MIVAIHQPQYIPWIGYFHKLDQADIFVLLDNVQFKKNEWQNRNRIKTSTGWQWLTVPVNYRFPQMISEVRINNRVSWRHKHLQAVQTNYGKAPFFKDYFPVFQEIWSQEWELLSPLNIHIIKRVVELLGIDTKLYIASQLENQFSSEPNRRLVEICEYFGAEVYLSGQGGRGYLDVELFRREGIEVHFQEFNPLIYRQLYGEFQPNLSIIDLLFNFGNEAINLIRGNKGG